MSVELATHIPEILRRWKAAVRAAPGARPEQPMLSGEVPGFLAALAEVLASPCESSDQHALTSRPTPHPLAQTLREYHLLRRAIVSVLETVAPLESRELQVIHDAIDYACEA